MLTSTFAANDQLEQSEIRLTGKATTRTENASHSGAKAEAFKIDQYTSTNITRLHGKSAFIKINNFDMCGCFTQCLKKRVEEALDNF